MCVPCVGGVGCVGYVSRVGLLYESRGLCVGRVGFH